MVIQTKLTVENCPLVLAYVDGRKRENKIFYLIALLLHPYTDVRECLVVKQEYSA